MGRLAFIPIADILDKITPEDMVRGEDDYRRGYHQGFAAAVSALQAYQRAGTPFDAGLESVADFADNRLREWRNRRWRGHCPPMAPAPVTMP